MNRSSSSLALEGGLLPRTKPLLPLGKTCRYASESGVHPSSTIQGWCTTPPPFLYPKQAPIYLWQILDDTTLPDQALTFQPGIFFSILQHKGWTSIWGNVYRISRRKVVQDELLPPMPTLACPFRPSTHTCCLRPSEYTKGDQSCFLAGLYAICLWCFLTWKGQFMEPPPKLPAYF